LKENKSFEKPCQTDFLLYWRQLKDKNSRKLKFPEATLPQNKFLEKETKLFLNSKVVAKLISDEHLYDFGATPFEPLTVRQWHKTFRQDNL
jgi:hypothetical protein